MNAQIQNGRAGYRSYVRLLCGISRYRTGDFGGAKRTADLTEASMSRCSVGICLLTDGSVETEHHTTTLDCPPHPLMTPLPVPFFEQAELNHNTTTVIDLGYSCSVQSRFSDVIVVSLVSSLWYFFPLCE